MMTVVMKRKYCTEISGGRVWAITQDTEVFSCDFGPRNGAENVTLYNFLSYFLTKKSYNKLSEKLIGTQNNIRRPEAIFSHLDHL